MKTKLVFFIFFALSVVCKAQYSIPELIVTGSCLVQAGGSTGSGFFIMDSLNIYFVTARHVLMSSEFNQATNKNKYIFISPTIQLNWYSRKAEESVSNTMFINVEQMLKNGNLKLGDNDEDDYLIMRIAKLNHKETFSEVIYSSFVVRPGASAKIDAYPIGSLTKFNEASIGDDIIMIGYPKSLGLKEIPQYDFNRPLLRKGMLAGKDVQHKTIIIDSPSYGGNSGGAVFSHNGYNFGDTEFKLIGIVSSFIPLQEKWINPNYGIQNTEFSNSGYTVVISIEKIFNQIEFFKKIEFK